MVTFQSGTCIHPVWSDLALLRHFLVFEIIQQNETVIEGETSEKFSWETYWTVLHEPGQKDILESKASDIG
jgi:hypothetical protein